MKIKDFINKFFKTKCDRIVANDTLIKINSDTQGIITYDTELLKVSPDGNCLIKTLLVTLLITQNTETITEILSPFLDPKNLLSLLQNKTKEDITKIIDKKIVKLCCQNIRKEIEAKWDYKGCPEYHMNPKAIDGLAREMVLRFFCIEELTIYSLVPEDDEDFKKVIQVNPSMFLKNIPPRKVKLLCPNSFYHYVAIL
jgi:hypothetical protein